MDNEKMTISNWCIKLNVRPAINDDNLYGDKTLYTEEEFLGKVPYESQVALYNETWKDRNNDLVITKLNEVIVLEEKLQKIKEIEKEIKNQKEELKQLMIETNMKKWETLNGTKITLVEDAEDEEIEVETVDYAKFNTEHLELFLKKEALEKEIKEAQKPYITITKETKKGRKGYVLITLPKNKEEK